MRPQFTCPNCGKPVQQGAKFCSYCGTNLAWSNQPEPPNWQQNEPIAQKGNSSAGAVFLTVLITLALVIAGFFLALNSHLISFYNGPAVVTQTTTVTPTPVQSPFISFNVTPAVITSGQTATIIWNVNGADSVLIDQGIGTVSISGSRVINPTSTTTYTLTATNAASSLSASITVTVNQLSLPVITGFAANPSAITSGQSTTLLWNATGATSASLNQGIGAVVPNGSKSVSPSVTTTYVLTATNAAGSVTATTTITVNPVALPTINVFNAAPSTINLGSSTTLSWDVSGATTVNIDQGVGGVALSGTRQVSPVQTTTYTLTATNGSGSVTASTIITISPTGLPTIVSFSSSPATINPGGITALSWNVTGATVLAIDQGIGVLATVTGTRNIVLATTTTFTLTASNSLGSVIASTTVTVVQAGLPVINSFVASPAVVAPGGASTLSWNVTGATNVIIDPGIGAVLGSGTRAVAVTNNVTYTLTAVNVVGTVTASVTITISTATPPVIYSFTASPSTLSLAQAVNTGVTLHWSFSPDVTSITINGVVPDTGYLGYYVDYPNVTGPKQYTLVASNSAGGSASAILTVTITP